MAREEAVTGPPVNAPGRLSVPNVPRSTVLKTLAPIRHTSGPNPGWRGQERPFLPATVLGQAVHLTRIRLRVHGHLDPHCTLQPACVGGRRALLFVLGRSRFLTLYSDGRPAFFLVPPGRWTQVHGGADEDWRRAPDRLGAITRRDVLAWPRGRDIQRPSIPRCCCRPLCHRNPADMQRLLTSTTYNIEDSSVEVEVPGGDFLAANGPETMSTAPAS